ncbi:MAG: hypothetical protein HZA11_10940 [Nitrospirae bacterium]|nr:hypothetical protein [Nitrospirota bacterium]
MKRMHTNRETDGLTNRVMSPSLLSLEERLSGIEKRMRIIEQSMGIFSSPESVDEFVNSESGRQEYKDAIRSWTMRRDRKPLDRFVEKTGGKVPR